MKLITKKTTLYDFERSRRWFIRCPKTGMIYKVEIIIMNTRSGDSYVWVTQNQDRVHGRHVRLINSAATAMENKAALLHRIQTKQFEIW